MAHVFIVVSIVTAKGTRPDVDWFFAGVLVLCVPVTRLPSLFCVMFVGCGTIELKVWKTR